YEEIGIVVHNGHAFPRNQHFPRDQMVEYYKGDTWEAISNALREPQAIWLMGVEDMSQTISQFVLEDGHTFRTWKKHTEIIEACKQLVNDTIDWQYQEGIINKEKKSILLESLKVVDLAEQTLECTDYHVNDVIYIDMKECYLASMRGQGKCTPWFNRFRHPTHYFVRVVVNGELPENDITGFAQIRSFKFASNIHSVIPVCGEGCGKEKEWAPIVLLRYLFEVGILESVTIEEAIISLTKQTKVWLPRNRDISCAIINKFTQGGKINKKCLTYQLVTNEDKLDFLIKDCTDAGTFAKREKSYAHINLLEMLRRFDPNEVQVEVKSDPNLCSHYPSCAMCTDPEELFISKSEYAKWIKEFLKTKRPLIKYDCKRHKPFVSDFALGNSFINQTPMLFHINQKNKKSEKFNSVNGMTKNRHWELIKNIPESTAPSIHDPITRCQKSYLNGGGGSGKTTCAIRIFKNINIVIFTHTNVLAKDFQEKRDVKAQTWHSFFRWNGVGEWTSERMGEKKFL
ncbi:4226_t:CDS:2, partial [Cetraspora pellucida]